MSNGCCFRFRAVLYLIGSLTAIATLRGACPDPAALQLFKERIAFERTWAEPSFKGMSLMHLNVWSSGQATGFYIRDPLGGNYSPRIRDTYVFVGNDGLRAGGACDLAENWTDCLRKFAAVGDARATTCRTAIDLRSIPTWKPSPKHSGQKASSRRNSPGDRGFPSGCRRNRCPRLQSAGPQHHLLCKDPGRRLLPRCFLLCGQGAPLRRLASVRDGATFRHKEMDFRAALPAEMSWARAKVDKEAACR